MMVQRLVKPSVALVRRLNSAWFKTFSMELAPARLLYDVCRNGKLVVIDRDRHRLHRHEYRNETADIFDHRVITFELVKGNHRSDEVDDELGDHIQKPETRLQHGREPFQDIIRDVENGFDGRDNGADDGFDDVPQNLWDRRQDGVDNQVHQIAEYVSSRGGNID